MGGDEEYADAKAASHTAFARANEPPVAPGAAIRADRFRGRAEGEGFVTGGCLRGMIRAVIVSVGCQMGGAKCGTSF